MSRRKRNSQNANPVREVRFARLVSMLNCGRSVSRKELEEKLEISRATLTRDIATLRDQLNMPIVYDHDTHGYLLASDGSNIGPRHHLPGLWLSSREAQALLTLINVTAAIDPGIMRYVFMPLRSWVKQLSGLISDTPPPIEEKLSIELRFDKKYNHQVFLNISPALYTDKSVNIHIHNSDYIFENASVQRYVLKNEGWYIDVYDAPSSKVVRIPMDMVESAIPMKRDAERLSRTINRLWMTKSGKIIPHEQL